MAAEGPRRAGAGCWGWGCCMVVVLLLLPQHGKLQLQCKNCTQRVTAVSWQPPSPRRCNANPRERSFTSTSAGCQRRQ
jgi:hypothetical protein